MVSIVRPSTTGGPASSSGPRQGRLRAEKYARLRALNCPVVMGNAEAWLLTGKASDAEPTTERQLAVREWQLTRLAPEDRAYIERFQPTVDWFHGYVSVFSRDENRKLDPLAQSVN